MEHVFVNQRAEDFLAQWFAALKKLTPQESTDILAQSTVESFAQVLKVSLSAEEFQRLKLGQIEDAHERMCEQLLVSVGNDTKLKARAN